jgi:hypothetical protein
VNAISPGPPHWYFELTDERKVKGSTAYRSWEAKSVSAIALICTYLLAHLLMTLLLEPLVEEFEDSPHWQLAALVAPLHNVAAANYPFVGARSPGRQGAVIDLAGTRTSGDLWCKKNAL